MPSALPTAVAPSSSVALSASRQPLGELHSFPLGDLMVSHGRHPAAGPPQRGAELLIPDGTRLILHQPAVEQILQPPSELLFLPSQANQVSRSAFHGWRLTLDPRRLSLLAAELSGHRLQPGPTLRQLAGLRVLQPLDNGGRQLSTSLRQLLVLCGQQDPEGRRQLTKVGLERCLLGLVVHLLLGEQLEAAPEPETMARHSRERCFEELLCWIRANLHRPIRLEELERQSCYSQRSLRNFFQERFQCGPVQWIRQQRLEAARQRLLMPQWGETVSQIAITCGYANLAQFSRDYQRAFLIRPSQVLREARRARLACEGEGSPHASEAAGLVKRTSRQRPDACDQPQDGDDSTARTC